jgi:uncharacterized protein YukE
VKTLERSLEEFDNKIAEAYQKFELIKQNLNSDLEAEVDFVMSQYWSGITKENAKDKFAQIDNVLGQNVVEMINKNISELINGFASSMQHFGQNLNDLNEYEIEDEYKEIKVRYDDSNIFQKGIQIITFGHFGHSYKTIKESVYVGDNKDEIILQFKHDRTQSYRQSTQEIYAQVMQEFFEPLKMISSNIKREINTLNEKIETYKTQLKHERG